MGARGHACNPRLDDAFETLQLIGWLARSVGLEEEDLGIAYVCPGVPPCDGSVESD